MENFGDILAKIVMYLIPFLLALCVHEYAHGWVANKLGDPTARLMGRLTLNPMAHADLVGTIILPILAITTGAPFFGWAKPVPVNSRNLRGSERVGMFWVALAGPGSNIIMAFMATLAFALAYRFLPGLQLADGIREFAKTFLMVNLSLAFFNLLPVHPLDGAKIIAIALPESVNRKLEELQSVFSILLLALFLSGGLARVLFAPVIATAQFMLEISLRLVGMT
jgi:Zn-dependent protease